MARFVENPLNVVEIPDSDDEGGDRPSGPEVQNNATIESDDRKLENRSFWKAGAFEIGPTKWNPSQGELEHARVHPKFLHSNATSHKWAFGAIAELLDNAVDEIAKIMSLWHWMCLYVSQINNGATFVKVDRIYSKRDNSPALLFLDDGGGMDPEGIRKCMSLGYSTKKTNSTIGQYGNGFKTSTMRLGADVIVFSCASRNGRETQSVGLLSYTFLRRTGQDDVIVPMIDFDVSKHWAEPIVYSSLDDWSANLKTILEWSPFASKEDLLQQDIKLRDEASRLSKVSKKAAETQAHISYRILHSLRAYASILYLRKFKNFKIFLRGKLVEQYSIAEDLNYREVVTYRPQVSSMKEASVETTLGFIKEAPAIGINGFNVYHKNRLIRPFWKVTSDGHSKGYGIVGVLEANFIEPAHDKQDFERSRHHCHLIGHKPDPGLLRKMQKVSAMPLHAQGERVNQTGAGLAANPRLDFSGSQMGSHGRTIYNNDTPILQAPPGFETGFDQDVAYGDGSRDIDQVCDENIQLFMRCEEYMQKENELKTTVEDLEKQVMETKRKCAEISSRLELLRRQKAFTYVPSNIQEKVKR
ncbi:Histidine kinase-like ATPase, ATP-binding domain-containing protein [Cynara cardunculus var. scolymus]|uniref:Histidine kinase-like ATPase, ATP-binding domain-containing protein n=1 Tax=Cynara cardunculus var. scolymus TaxID=59895 RepID=A0A103XKL2_CYNCS|nr:Histidine kinase-like ATPase, ATP-binding domain-containing protein [Cynara cardunculus var. scolymus]